LRTSAKEPYLEMGFGTGGEGEAVIEMLGVLSKLCWLFGQRVPVFPGISYGFS
jgi:hypothetical protein